MSTSGGGVAWLYSVESSLVCANLRHRAVLLNFPEAVLRPRYQPPQPPNYLSYRAPAVFGNCRTRGRANNRALGIQGECR